MAQVPEKVLAWLYSVLHEYQDPQRSYSDAARALSAYANTITPRTEVYTGEDGTSALLLVLSGNLPVAYKGTTYRYPVKLWIPQAYPQEAPMVYVTPGRDMMIRPGQHVGVDGRVYLPYLRDWIHIQDRASVEELLEYLQQVFAKEPPVISRTQQQQDHSRPIAQPSSQPAVGASTAAPQLPPKQRAGSVEHGNVPNGSGPPPRPPKPGEGTSLPPGPEWNVTRDGPPLPPLPHERQPGQYQAPGPSQDGHYNGTYDGGPQTRTSYDHGRSQNRPTPFHGQPARTYQEHSSPVTPIAPAQHGSGYVRSPLNSSVSDTYAHQQMPHSQLPQPPQVAHQLGSGARAQQQDVQPIQHQHHPKQQNGQFATPQLMRSKQAPPPDLLSDPFENALSGPRAEGPAPPIPPNPEKEHLLHALSTALVQQAHQKVSQNLSAIAPLQTQHVALANAHARLEAEIRQLEQLSATLDSNERILRRAIQECDSTITSAKSKPQPPIDDVLVAPTIVAQQLWNLTAEEAAIREAMYVLQKAVDRGRVSADVFVKQMRGLGREAFLKTALARKCAQGMGLDMHR